MVRSSARPSASRLVASAWASGAPVRMASTRSRADARTCSQLSSTTSPPPAARKSTTDSLALRPAGWVAPSAASATCGTASALVAGARSTHHTSGEVLATRCATSSATRVLPMPPTPTSVTSGAVATLSTAAATSAARPTSAPSGRGSRARRAVGASSLRSGGNSRWRPGAASWKTRSLRSRSLRRCSPRSSELHVLVETIKRDVAAPRSRREPDRRGPTCGSVPRG